MKKELKHNFLSFLRFTLFILMIYCLVDISNSFDFFREQEEKSIQLNKEIIAFNEDLIKEYKIDLKNNEKLKDRKLDITMSNVLQ